MTRRTLKQWRVLARIQAVEDRQQWEDAKWQRFGAFLLDFLGGSALGIAFGLSLMVWFFVYVTRVAA